MKYRRHNWYHEQLHKVMFGIQGNPGDGRGWLNMAYKGKGLLFNTEQERTEKMKELRADERSKFSQNKTKTTKP